MSIAVAMGLCSCGKPDIRQTTSRIAARVNGEEVSVHQIDSVFARNNNMTPERAGRAATLARERVIDQELLVQEALEGKLNRDAHVARAIERARRQILAQAYIERAVISAPLASPEEISNFYEENPALFEQRRIYRVLELVVVVPPAAFSRIPGGGRRQEKPRRGRTVARFAEASFRHCHVQQGRGTDPNERAAPALRDARRTNRRFSNASRRFRCTARAVRGCPVERETGHTRDRAIPAQPQAA